MGERSTMSLVLVLRISVQKETCRLDSYCQVRLGKEFSSQVVSGENEQENSREQSYGVRSALLASGRRFRNISRLIVM